MRSEGRAKFVQTDMRGAWGLRRQKKGYRVHPGSLKRLRYSTKEGVHCQLGGNDLLQKREGNSRRRDPADITRVWKLG